MVTSSGDRVPLGDRRYQAAGGYPQGWQPLLQGPYWTVHLPAETYADEKLRAEWQQAGFGTTGPPSGLLTAGHQTSELCLACSQLPEGPGAAARIGHMRGVAAAVALAQAGRRG